MKNVLVLLSLAFLVSSCDAVDQSENSTAAVSKAVCQDIADQSFSGRRASFTYDFDTAELQFSKIIRAYTLAEERGEVLDCRLGLTKSAAQLNLGLAYSSQRQFRLADAMFDKAEKRIAQDPEDGLDSLLKLYRAQHLLHQYGEPGWSVEPALNLTSDGLELSEETSISGGELLDSDLFGLSPQVRDVLLASTELRYVRAFALQTAAKEQQSREEIERAIAEIRSVDGIPPSYLAKYQVQYASVLGALGESRAAVTTSRAACDQLERELPNSPVTAQCWMVHATSLLAEDDVSAADSAFQNAFGIYESNPIPLRYERIWPYIRMVATRSQRAAGSDQAVNISDEVSVAQIFRASQLVRSSQTASDITATAAAFADGDGAAADAVSAWRDAETEVAKLKAALTQFHILSPEQVEQLEGQLGSAQDRVALLKNQRDIIAPEYKAALEAPISLADIQDALKPGEAVLQVMSGSPRSIIILIEKDSARIRVVKFTDSQISELVSILRLAFASNPAQRIAFSAEGSYLVTSQLFGDLLPDIRKQTKIYFSTNGALQNIPLEVLVTENPSENPNWTSRADNDYTAVRWLVDDVQIGYLPQPRNLSDLRSRAGRSSASKSLIAFGGHEPDATVKAVLEATGLPATECGGVVDIVANLPALPGTTREVSRAATAIGGGARTIVGPEFTQNKVEALSESGELSDYKIVHFATHGLLWQSPDCIGEPALTVTIGGDSTSDGLLRSSEVRALRLDADMVVLSACETVGGDERLGSGGENLSGLARAFFASGSRAVTASHWQIDDDSTSDMMALMYEKLGSGSGTSYDDALSHAQTQLRSSPARSSPYFWAPFVLIGDGSAVFSPLAE